MSRTSTYVKLGIACLLMLICVICIWIYRQPLWHFTRNWYHLLSNREQVKAFITSFGWAAPFVFISFQILQVIFAPLPGEMTGFIGGFIFGAAKGFVYSTIGLTVGSWINFFIGRWLGRQVVGKLVPARYMERYDNLIKKKGLLVIFLCFILPGFPKDYLCLFVGMSTIPARIFILLAGIGRMPGTLLLSLQGEFLFDRRYGLLAVVMGISLVIIIIAYWYRNALNRWMDRINGEKKSRDC